MRAAIFHGPGDVRIEHVPVPAPGPGEVLVRIEAALTDGTDAKCYLRGHPVLPARRRRRSGTSTPARSRRPVRARGSGPATGGRRELGAVRRVQPCLADREELCTGLFPLLNGAYAEYLLVPERIASGNLYRLPDDVDAAIGAMCEPLACALHGVEATEARAGDRVCVLGRGALGRMLAASLAARGCEVVALGSADPDPDGAFDRVIEAAGTAEAWERAVRLAAPGATVVPVRRAAGRHLGARRRLPAPLPGADAAGRVPPCAQPRAGGGRAGEPRPGAVRALITHEFALDEVVVPLEMTAGMRPRDGILKAAIRP